MTSEIKKSQNIFGDFSRIVSSWYAIAQSSELKSNQAINIEIFGKKRVVFRTATGKVNILDARCAHMGAMLGSGEVIGECIRCPFHFWSYDENGKCVDIPYKDEVPEKARVRTWPCVEKNGLIYMYYGEAPHFEVPEFDLKGFSQGKPMKKRFVKCHPHIMLSNGVDIPHWSAVHGLDVEKGVDLNQIDENTVHYRLTGHLHDQPSTISHKIYHFLKLKKFDADWTCYGGNISLVEIHAPFSAKLMLNYRADDEGNYIQAVTFHKKRSVFSNILGVSKLINFWHSLLIGVLFFDDLLVMNTIDFQRNFTSKDKNFIKWIRFVNGLKVFQED